MAGYCDATTRRGTSCKRPAGWGTEHPGNGRCKLHGGRSPGAPEGNKHAVTTGEYETIWLDQLDEQERELYPRINPDAMAQLDEEIRLTTIRERRMLARIRLLEPHDFTVVERTVEQKQGVDAGSEDEDSTGSVDVITTRQIEHSTLGQIQAIELALNRVQSIKTRLIDLRYRLHSGDESDDVLSDLTAAIARSRQEHERRQAEADE